MTGYLADTHAIIWLFQTPGKLPTSWLTILAGTDTVFASTASFWEIAIKARIGKLNADPHFPSDVLAKGFRHLPIDLSHIAAFQDLPAVDGHRDPFDRMLIAQATVEDLTILTADRKFAAYNVRTV